MVKNLTDYGAFVDLGGIDGLLHITDMAWKRVRHPSEVVNVGEELDVRVLKYDRERNRVTLGLKQLGEDPWDNIARRYPTNTRLFGKVSNVTDYGAFVEIEPGVEGLVHVSEMDWTNKNVNPSKVVQVGDEVEVMVLDVDEERRRISLGIKQVASNPWEAFAAIHKKGDKVSGQIKSITDFGIFIGLDGGIDGLVHLSDISWNTTGEDVVAQLQEGRHAGSRRAGRRSGARAHLARRQAARAGSVRHSTWPPTRRAPSSTARSRKWTPRARRSSSPTASRATSRARDIAKERVEDATQHLKVGDEVEAKFIGMDRKGRTLQLSIRAKDEADMAEVAGRVQQGVRCLQRHDQARCAAARAAEQQVRVSSDTARRSGFGPALRGTAMPSRLSAAAQRPSSRASRMTKSELIEILSRRQAHLKADDVDLAVKTLLEMMSDALTERRAHRDPRLRQLLPALPSAAPGPQSRRPATRSRCPASTSRISSPARNCASASARGAASNRRLMPIRSRP